MTLIVMLVVAVGLLYFCLVDTIRYRQAIEWAEFVKENIAKMEPKPSPTPTPAPSIKPVNNCSGCSDEKYTITMEEYPYQISNNYYFEKEK